MTNMPLDYISSLGYELALQKYQAFQAKCLSQTNRQIVMMPFKLDLDS
jgi:hypothetical protein